MAEQKIKRPYQSMRVTEKERVRVVDFVAWPESVNMERLEMDIERSHVKVARSPLHDRDEYDRNDVEKWLDRHGWTVDCDWSLEQFRAFWESLDKSDYAFFPWIGDHKKPHYHYVVVFEGNKYLKDLVALTGGQISYFEKAFSKHGSLKYLIHANAPTKAQYLLEDVKAYGGIDLSPIVQIGELEQMDYFFEVEDYIRKNRVSSLWQLSAWAARQDSSYQIRKCIKQNYGYFKSLIMDGNAARAAAKRALGPAPKDLQGFEGGMFSTPDL